MTILIIVILYWVQIHHITSASTQCPDDQSLLSCFSFFILQEPFSNKTLISPDTLALCVHDANSLLCFAGTVFNLTLHLYEIKRK